MNHFNTLMQLLAIAIIPLLFAITLHEAAHGYIANLFGDKTAWMLGRVSLNPIRHIDFLGTIVVPLITLFFGGVIFGWAKPVPISSRNFKNPRRDMALVALAGPGANLFMAIMWGGIAKLTLILINNNQPLSPFMDTVSTFFQATALFGIRINAILLFLNLLPIPPLDGSQIINSLLPPSLSTIYERIEPYGFWILLALIFTGILSAILWPPIRHLELFIQQLFRIGN